mgnify:CR=1 FL=1
MTGLVSEKFQVTKIAAADFATTYPNVGVDMEAVGIGVYDLIDDGRERRDQLLQVHLHIGCDDCATKLPVTVWNFADIVWGWCAKPLRK